MRTSFDDVMLGFVFHTASTNTGRTRVEIRYSLSQTGKSDARAAEVRLLSFVSTMHVWTHGRDVLCSVHTYMSAT